MPVKKEQRFLVDPSLGRLAKWLRILGFDTVYFNVPLIEKQFFEKAVSESRLILTRSKKIKLQLKEEDYFFIVQNNIDEQLKELINANFLPFPEDISSRCMECNELLKEIDRNQIHGMVPDYILETQQFFRQCNICKKIFWPGTHQTKMKKKIEELYRHNFG